MSQPLLLLHPVDEVFVDTIRSTSAWVPQTMHAHAHTHGDECTHADARLTDDAGTQHNGTQSEGSQSTGQDQANVRPVAPRGRTLPARIIRSHS